MIHTYHAEIRWDGSSNETTSSYTSYTRNHTIRIIDKPDLLGSADPHFRGDPSRYNPEELFLSSIASCHMLWYLHLCADNNIKVTSYEDQPIGEMKTEDDGSGSFSSVELRPHTIITKDADLDLAYALHDKAHSLCFIANSCNFLIHCTPDIVRLP